MKENKVVTNGSTVTVTDKDDDLPRKITFSKVNLAGEEIAGAKIQIFRGEKLQVILWLNGLQKPNNHMYLI